MTYGFPMGLQPWVKVDDAYPIEDQSWAREAG